MKLLLEKLTLSLIAIGVLIIPGCESGYQQEKSEIPEFKLNKTEKTKGNCKDEGAPCFTIKIQMPEAVKGSPSFRSDYNEATYSIILTSLGYFSADTLIASSIEQAIDDLFSEFEAYMNVMGDDDGFLPMGWSIELTGEILYESDNIITLETNLYGYLGGAHPNQWVRFYNFDTETGKLYAMNEVLSDIPSLSKKAESIFRSKYEIGEDSLLEDLGYWIEEGAFKLPENFAFTSTGITFLYNAYEIGPYSMGIHEITIPYEALKNHLILNSR